MAVARSALGAASPGMLQQQLPPATTSHRLSTRPPATAAVTGWLAGKQGAGSAKPRAAERHSIAASPFRFLICLKSQRADTF